MLKTFGAHVRGNVVGYVALFLALGGTTYAATGDFLKLGNPNQANAPTSLSASPAFAGKALQVTNNSTAAGATALGLTVGSGRPPFTVNSGTKVANLNADKLDGLDSTSFVPNSKVRRVGPVSITLPPSGGLLTSPIATVGHFTFTGYCQVDTQTGNAGVRLAIGSDVAHSTYGSLTQSQAGGQFSEGDMGAGTDYNVAIYGPTPTGFPQFNPAMGSAVAPDGQQVTFEVYQGAGARNQGNECIFGGTFAVN
jgi:hypothetical protein